MAKSRKTKDGAALYVGAALVSLFCLWIVDDLWNADLRYPITALAGDAIGMQAHTIKAMVDNPWYLDNEWLGAPFGLNFRDICWPDLLILAVVKLLALFTKQHILIRNILAVGSYPLVTLTSLFVMRRLGIRPVIALVGSLLYAFIGFHQARIGPHLFFGISYFTVPFATLLALSLFDNEPLFLTAVAGRRFPSLLMTRHTWVAVIWCVIMGMTGSAYNAFFSVYLLLVAGILAALRFRSLIPLLRGVCATVAIIAALVVAELPLIMHTWSHGHAAALIRNPQAAEVYALKIAQLLTPGMGHRLAALQRFSDFYNRVAPVVNENTTAYVGAVGACGFLVLIFVLIRQGEQFDTRLRSLSVFNIAALLLGTVGGLSSLIAFFASDMIRSYNRISVFVAYFSLLGLALLGEQAAKTWVKSNRHEPIAMTLLAGILCLGLWDQTTPAPDYNAMKKAYVAQANFVRQIEQSVPPKSSIFQYPYFQFPERPPMEKLGDYAEFMPYLHSKALRWSYGTQKGRRGDAWQANIAGMAPDQAVEALAQAGFSGIYISRDGYADRGKNLETSLKSLLGRPVAVSADGNSSFYSLVERTNALRARWGDQEYERRKVEALTPMYLGWLGGCYPPDSHKNGPRIWCQSTGHFVIDNPSQIPTHLVLEAKLSVGEAPAKVRIRSDVMNHEAHVTDRPYTLSEGFDVPPGEHIFTVTTSGPGKTDEYLRDLHVAFDDPHLEVIVRSAAFDGDKTAQR
jgi:hypothetical protein